MVEVISQQFKPGSTYEYDPESGTAILVVPDNSGVFLRQTSSSGLTTVVGSLQNESVVISIQTENPEQKTTDTVRKHVKRGANGIFVDVPQLGNGRRFLINNQ